MKSLFNKYSRDIFILVLSTIVIIAFYGCSIENEELATTSISIVDSTTKKTQFYETKTTTTIEPKLKKFSNTAAIPIESGEEFLLTLIIWEPILYGLKSPAEHPDNSNLTIEYNPQKDLVIPLQIKIKKTKSSSKLEEFCSEVDLFVDSPNTIPIKLKNYLSKIKEIKCTGYFGFIKLQTAESFWQLKLNSGSLPEIVQKPRYSGYSIVWPSLNVDDTAVANHFVIIYDYFTSAYPEGCKEMLDMIGVCIRNKEEPKLFFSGRRNNDTN